MLYNVPWLLSTVALGLLNGRPLRRGAGATDVVVATEAVAAVTDVVVTTCVAVLTSVEVVVESEC